MGNVGSMIQAGSPKRRVRLLAVLAVVIAAVVMGLPTLGGSFVGGDDHRLLLNHVFVNHPSLSHAVKLFGVVHRDLYQPLALLSFQIEFAIAKTLGLFDTGVEAGTWLFHLTNIILHAVNAVLVWLTVAKLDERMSGRSAPSLAEAEISRQGVGDAASIPAVPTVAALLFAVHPLQAEVVAWTNGRMMLLSTLFGLLSLLSFASWLDHPRAKSGVLTALFVLLSAISKVRVGLPVLLVLLFLARRAKFRWGTLWLWCFCVLVTGILVLVNVQATAGAALFSEASEHLRGPRTVRVLLAMANYFEHMVWPVGLASYYPTPPLVRWSDAGTWQAVLIVAAGLFAMGWASLRVPAARLGVVWFFATIASTLPLFPARNVLAADRYMYLPIIGLLWMIAAVATAGYRRWLAARSPALGRATITLLGVAVVPACVGMSWHVSWFYATPLRKTQRIASLNPDTPRVWERVGWSYHKLGEYEEAIECGNRELRFDAPAVRSGGYQLLGMCEVHRGNAETGLELLAKGIEVDPRSPLAKYRLAVAYEELGRPEEALPYFEAAVEQAPSNNPTINRLAALYRTRGRPGDARAMYEKAIHNNPYEVAATLGLAELDIAEGTRASYAAAERRLMELLETMPEHDVAWTNLGVVRMALGRASEAAGAYTTALERNPNNVTAALNLAQIYHRDRLFLRAEALYERAAAGGLESVDQAVIVHDFFVSRGKIDRAVLLWADFLERFPGSTGGRVFAAWTLALAGAVQQAEAEVSALAAEGTAQPLAYATRAYLAHITGRYDQAAAVVDVLCELGEPGGDARRRLLGALDRFDQQRPDNPWTFCLAARLLIAEGNLDGARIFAGLCEQRCNAAPCRDAVQALRASLPEPAVPTSNLQERP